MIGGWGRNMAMKMAGQLPAREFGIVKVCLSNGLKGKTVKASEISNH